MSTKRKPGLRFTFVTNGLTRIDYKGGAMLGVAMILESMPAADREKVYAFVARHASDKSAAEEPK